jgi:hypothetical protein
VKGEIGASAHAAARDPAAVDSQALLTPALPPRDRRWPCLGCSRLRLAKWGSGRAVEPEPAAACPATCASPFAFWMRRRGVGPRVNARERSAATFSVGPYLAVHLRRPVRTGDDLVADAGPSGRSRLPQCSPLSPGIAGGEQARHSGDRRPSILHGYISGRAAPAGAVAGGATGVETGRDGRARLRLVEPRVEAARRGSRRGCGVQLRVTSTKALRDQALREQPEARQQSIGQ